MHPTYITPSSAHLGLTNPTTPLNSPIQQYQYEPIKNTDRERERERGRDNKDIDTDMLEDYKSKITIMSRLCQEAGGYFTGIKNKMTLPLIIISAGLVILNSLSTNAQNNKNQEIISYINIFLNAINFIIISYLAQFKITEKSQTFRNARDDFIKLLHNTDTAKNGGTLNNQFLSNLIDKYDTLIASCPSIPQHIKNKVMKEIGNAKALPVVLTATLVQTDIGIAAT